VTQKDIDNGVRSEPGSCPVALALRRTFKAGKAGVGASTMRVGEFHSKEYKSFDATKTVYNFIAEFDKNGRNGVKPFSFTATLKYGTHPRKN